MRLPRDSDFYIGENGNEGIFFSFSAGNWRDKERNSVSRGRGRSAAMEEQVERKWARELEGGWERERGRGGSYCIPVASVQSNKI